MKTPPQLGASALPGYIYTSVYFIYRYLTLVNDFLTASPSTEKLICRQRFIANRLTCVQSRPIASQLQLDDLANSIANHPTSIANTFLKLYS